MNTKAVIYARVSSEGDRQSTDRQVRDLTSFAEANHYNLVKVFTEQMSGARDDRPILGECLDYCCNGGADILLIGEISRLGRSVKIIVDTKERLTKAGVNIYIQDLNLFTLLADGTENPAADIIVTVLGLGAQIERKQIVNRLNSGRKAAIAKGVHMGRKVGSVKSKEQKRTEYQRAINLLKKGTSVRNTAVICTLSPGTVQTIKKEFVTLMPEANDDPLSLDTMLATGKMSRRLYDCLSVLGYISVKDITQKTEKEYLVMRGIGKSTIDEMHRLLTENGIDWC